MGEGVEVIGFELSPFSKRVELALKLKAVDYEYIEEVSLNYKNNNNNNINKKKSDLVLKYNPIYKKVPVLLHNGNPISESLIILEYIDENWKTNNPIFPQHPLQRATARFWANYMDHKFYLLWLKAARSGREVRNEGVEEACKALEPLENELIKSNIKYFGGDSIGLVDIAGIFIAYWVPVMQQALGIQILSSHRFPKLTKWSERLVSNSLVKEILPTKDAIFAYTQTIYKINLGNSKL